MRNAGKNESPESRNLLTLGISGAGGNKFPGYYTRHRNSRGQRWKQLEAMLAADSLRTLSFQAGVWARERVVKL